MTLFLPELTVESAEKALTGWATLVPKPAVLAFLPEGSDVTALQTACRRLGLTLNGAVFPAILSQSTLYTQGAVLLADGRGPTILVKGTADPRTATRAIAQIADFVEAHADPAKEYTLFCVFDALDPLIATHLDELYLRLADLVHYVGVNAGSERFAPIPCLFDNDACVAGGTLVQLLPRHPGACLEHGFKLPEMLRMATAANGNRIVQIDWRPALEVYREMMLQQYGLALTRENFYQLAVNFPIGILRANDDVLVRIPVRLDDDGGIACIGEIPTGAVLTLLDAKAKGQDAPGALAQKLRSLPGAPFVSLVLFYCAGRRLEMGADVSTELARTIDLAGAATAVGALTLGEIGPLRSGGYPLFHNATIVGMPWPSP